jgi:exodeoxyribonuclease VII small subunit
MSDDRSTFETTRARLEDIVVQVRRKDVSLEQSLDMLEEAVRLVNQCNELIDQTSFRAPAAVVDAEAAAAESPADASTGEAEAAHAGAEAEAEEAAGGPAAEDLIDDGEDFGEDASVDTVTVVETFEMIELDGEDLASIEFVAFDEVEGTGTPDAGIEDDERS